MCFIQGVFNSTYKIVIKLGIHVKNLQHRCLNFFPKIWPQIQQNLKLLVNYLQLTWGANCRFLCCREQWYFQDKHQNLTFFITNSVQSLGFCQSRITNKTQFATATHDLDLDLSTPKQTFLLPRATPHIRYKSKYHL